MKFCEKWLPTLKLDWFKAGGDTSTQVIKTWENKVWPLIKNDLKTSFEITWWNGDVKEKEKELNKKYDQFSDEEKKKLNEEWFKDVKEEYKPKEKESGFWVLLRTDKDKVIATTWVDYTAAEKDELKKQKLPDTLPELFVLKVDEEYESLGVGRYLTYQMHRLLFQTLSEEEELARQNMMKKTLEGTEWNEPGSGIVLIPSTSDEKGFYLNWKTMDPAPYEIYDEEANDKKFGSSLIVTDPKHETSTLTSTASTSGGSSNFMVPFTFDESPPVPLSFMDASITVTTTTVAPPSPPHLMER